MEENTRKKVGHSMKRDYDSSPVADSLGLRDVILGLANDLQELRDGKASPQDALARAALAKQMFNGVRLYLQALTTLEGTARPITSTREIVDAAE